MKKAINNKTKEVFKKYTPKLHGIKMYYNVYIE